MHAEINRSTVPSVWRVYQLSDYAGGFATSLINCWKHLANICSWFQGSTFRGFSDKSWLPCLCAKSRLSSTSCPTSLSYRELHQDWLVPNVFYRCSNQPWCSYRGCTSEKLQGKMARSSVKAEWLNPLLKSAQVRNPHFSQVLWKFGRGFILTQSKPAVQILTKSVSCVLVWP